MTLSTRLEWEEAIAQREIAGVARWLIENRDALLQMTARTVDVRPLEKLPGHVEIRGSSGSDSYVIFPKSF